LREVAEAGLLDSEFGLPNDRHIKNTLAGKLLGARVSVAAQDQRILLMQSRPQHLADLDNPDAVFPISGPGQTTAAFGCLSSEGTLGVGQPLWEALLLLGHPYAERQWLDEVVDTECSGRSNLDLEDFQFVVGNFEQRRYRELYSRFQAHAGSGSAVAASKLPTLVAEAGVPLMPGVADELLSSVAPEVELFEFMSVFQDLLSRAGLTQREHQRVREIFEELEDVQGTISVQELRTGLMWHESLTNLAGGQDIIKAIVSKTQQHLWEGRLSLKFSSRSDLMSAPGSQPEAGMRVSGVAFLAAAREVHEHVAENLRAALEQLGYGAGQAVDSVGLLSLLEELGFISAMPSDVDAFLAASNLKSEDKLQFAQVYALIFRYCDADGITEADQKDMDDMFRLFDTDRSGTLEAGEIGPVIRWLGYQPNQFRVYDFAEEIGLNEESHISPDDMRKISAKYKRMSLQAARNAFLAVDPTGSDCRIPLSQLDQLMRMVGFEPTDEEVADLVELNGGEESSINFREFKQLEQQHRSRTRQAMERNGGFTDGELARHLANFKKHDPAGSGSISQKALREHLQELYPPTQLDKTRHERIAQMVKESDLDGNGLFDMEEYLGLMKKLTEEMDSDILLRGLRLKTELGYSGAEVKEFRDLYHVCDEDMSGDIDFNELASIIGNLVRMDKDAKRELRDIFVSVDDGNGLLDFWEFLSLMHRIQSINWRNIGGKGQSS